MNVRGCYKHQPGIMDYLVSIPLMRCYPFYGRFRPLYTTSTVKIPRLFGETQRFQLHLK